MKEKRTFAALKLITAAFICVWITAMAVQADLRTVNTDVSDASEGCTILGLEGTYYVQIQAALDRINEIRYEACKEGVKDKKTGQPLSPEDYVPIKWSGDLEYIARIRAAEAAVTMGHVRTNGSSCFYLSSPTGVELYAEDLAWNSWSESMVTAINQWYEEKEDWIKQTPNAVTGHYTSLIDPEYLYIGLGTFCSDTTPFYSSTAAELSPVINLSETPVNWSGKCVQLLEFANSSLTNQIQLTGNLSGQAGSVSELKATTSAQFDYRVSGLLIPGSILWESSDSKVATVNSDGKVQAKYCGSTDITAKPVGMTGSATAAFTVDHKKVTDAKVAATCTKTGLTAGEHCPVCGVVFKAQEKIPKAAHKWNSGTVTKEATALAAGVLTKTCSVCGETETSAIAKLKPTCALSHTELEEEIGQTTTVSVSGLAKGDSVKSWKSADQEVATVTSKGAVKGIKAGSTTVTVTLASGKAVPIEVTVIPATTKSINGLSKTVKIKKGQQLTLQPVRYPSVSREAFSYKSSNKKVATVTSKGVVEAVGKGTAKITVKSGKASFTVTVKVPITRTKQITGIEKKLTLKKGETFTLKPIRTPSNSDQKIKYKSSRKTVVSVSSSGKLKAKKKGKAVITITSGTKSVKCKVTVK